MEDQPELTMFWGGGQRAAGQTGGAGRRRRGREGSERSRSHGQIKPQESHDYDLRAGERRRERFR